MDCTTQTTPAATIPIVLSAPKPAALIAGTLFGRPIDFVDADTGTRRQQVRIAIVCHFCGATHNHGWTLGPAVPRCVSRIAIAASTAFSQGGRSDDMNGFDKDVCETSRGRPVGSSIIPAVAGIDPAILNPKDITRVRRRVVAGWIGSARSTTSN